MVITIFMSLNYDNAGKEQENQWLAPAKLQKRSNGCTAQRNLAEVAIFYIWLIISEKKLELGCNTLNLKENTHTLCPSSLTWLQFKMQSVQTPNCVPVFGEISGITLNGVTVNGIIEYHINQYDITIRYKTIKYNILLDQIKYDIVWT